MYYNVEISWKQNVISRFISVTNDVIKYGSKLKDNVAHYISLKM